MAGVGGWLSRPQPIPVILAQADRGSVEATLANTRAGEVEACQRAKLSTIQGGRIEFLGVKEGDRVKAGQVLLRLWNEDQQAQLDVSRTQLDAARRRVGEACSTAQNAAQEAARQAQLRQRGFVSTSREEQARFEAAARAAACDTARADVATAQARVKASTTDQRRTVLLAPFDGTVAKITGELGEFSTPSPVGVMTPPAIDLIDDACLYITAPMDEVDAPRIHAGQTARIRIDALPDQRFEGRVRRVAPYVAAVEKQARTVDVEVEFLRPEEARGLLVGYSADVEIVLDRHDDVLRIPTSALREGNRLLVLPPDGETLEERTIQPGLANWDHTEIKAGLTDQERFVTSLERPGIKPGARVRPEAPPKRQP
ncbi:MAG: efflux RND transporter periplasmic adaptor subunit [Rhodocyclaceae bacterium]|nr:efflux RND transporter periplasmic adaptor subunit [Rhodocyclaceae bacterium]